jgi:hypothetical protein
MEAFFTSLTKRQAMLLLTGVTFGGPECLAALDHLPDDEAELLKQRAAAILAIPREKRVPFLVQEIKRLVTSKRIDDLRGADPRRIAEALRPERPALAEVILRALPAALATKVRAELGLKPVRLEREVQAEILSVVRWKFEKRLESMMPKRPQFTFADLLTLAGREVIALCDGLGAKALATAIAGLPQPDREQFLKALPPDQRVICAKAASAAAGRRLESADAREVLDHAASGATPSDAVRLAGLRRLARACVGNSPEFAAALIERHRSAVGRELARFVSEERQQPARRGDELLAEEVLVELERLAVRGVVEAPLRLAPPPAAPGSRLAPEKAAVLKGPMAKAPATPPAEEPTHPNFPDSQPTVESRPPRPQRMEMPVVGAAPRPRPRGPSRGET